jgi:glycosyltransferase involved in cell wall biosynthesis
VARVLYFVEPFWPLIGGVEIVSARLVRALAGRGHEVVVVCDRSDASLPALETYAGVAVHRLPLLRAIRERDLDSMGRARRAMATIVRDLRPQLVHAAFTGPGIWALPRPEVAPLILSFHAGNRRTLPAGDGLFGRTVARAAWITACSRAVLGELLACRPELAGRSSVIRYGLEPLLDGEPSEPPAGPPVLLCSGRVVPEKGLEIAIDALAILAETDRQARLVLAGDGPERPALEARAAALGLADRIMFTGWVSPEDTHRLVADSTVVLVPSREEPFGLVAIEASLMARPVVAAAVGGLPEAVVDGVTGVLVPAGDPAALATAVRRLLAAPGHARALGRAGRRRVLAEFAAETEADEWDALYRRFAAT